MFVAVRGANRHGAEFAATAAEKGAVAVVTDAAGAELAAASGLPVVVVDDPRGQLGDLSAWVYSTGRDDDLPILFAPTGTNGKTSVSHLLEGILGQLGVTTGLSSTAERHIAGQVIVSRLTTPEAYEMHALLALMRERGVEAVAVEVSAQALSRRRVDGIVFDVAGFTNLTHDHLDDYADMREYFEAKLPLFRPDRARRAVVCLDSAPGRRSGRPQRGADGDGGHARDRRGSRMAAAADWIVEILEERPAGTDFRLASRDGRSLTTVVPVIGRHMAANAGLAIVMILEGGYAWERLVDALDGGRIDAYLPGRTELVSGERGPAVYVDFGHSPDAFEKTLAAVRRVTPGKVVMLFGADGDRDATKRHDMGRAGVLGSDILVITDHHPRFENPGFDPRDPGRRCSASATGCRHPRVLAAGARDRRGRRASSATGTRSCGPAPATRTTATSAARARRTRRASSPGARCKAAGWPVHRAALAGAVPAGGLTAPRCGAPRARARPGSTVGLSGRMPRSRGPRHPAPIARPPRAISRVSARVRRARRRSARRCRRSRGTSSRPSWKASTACSFAALNTAG